MKIQLSDEECERIEKYTGRIERLKQNISVLEGQKQNLMAQGEELVDVANTSFRDAGRRVKLENPELANEDIPELINENGELVVTIHPDKTAEWQSAHDVKRVGNTDEEPEIVEEKSDVEQA